MKSWHESYVIDDVRTYFEHGNFAGCAVTRIKLFHLQKNSLFNIIKRKIQIKICVALTSILDQNQPSGLRPYIGVSVCYGTWNRFSHVLRLIYLIRMVNITNVIPTLLCQQVMLYEILTFRTIFDTAHRYNGLVT